MVFVLTHRGGVMLPHMTPSQEKRSQNESYLDGTCILDLPVCRRVKDKFLFFNLPVHVCILSCFSYVRLWHLMDHSPIARQAPLSVGFSRQEFWSGLPFPPPGDLPDPVIKPTSLKSPVLAGRFFTITTTCEALLICQFMVFYYGRSRKLRQLFWDKILRVHNIHGPSYM